MTNLRRNDRSRGAPLAAIAHARDAYRRGDFAAVYVSTERALSPKEPASDLHLLRARALLREHRAEDAEALLAPHLASFDDADSAATAAMLYATAIGRRDPETGLAMLVEAERTGRRHAHPSILAEIAYRRAQTHWIRGEIAQADRLATITESANVDVLAVHATHLRGFVAVAQGRLNDALVLFETARRAYGRCREHDVEVAMIVLQQIASLEQTLRSDTVPGTHGGRNGRTIPRSAVGLGASSAWRVRLCVDDAWLFALDGDAVRAYAKAREAERVAPTPAWRVRGLASRAAIAAAFGEVTAAQSFAVEARALASHVDWNATVDDERFALLMLAEVFSSFDAAGASEILSAFNAIESPIPATRVLRTGDQRLRGWTAFVRASVAQAQGHLAVAAPLYTTALHAFRTCGYRWREAQTLAALADLPPSVRTDDVAAPLDEAVALVARHFPKSFLARQFDGWMRVYVDPRGRMLSPAQREVLRWLLEGRTPREIAAIKGRGYETIRTHIRMLHRAFGTRAEHQLVAECVRRGILPPRAEPDQRAEPRARIAPRTS
ncbi:MAG: Bacterial regulatory protein luxR family [Candidatus Eremiobacteraeota bacterium]|nr:Bacterial regulatory protein luxR family [Candidatus Eremiobacteraeota bacterium]